MQTRIRASIPAFSPPAALLFAGVPRYACEKAPGMERKFGNICSLRSLHTHPSKTSIPDHYPNTMKPNARLAGIGLGFFVAKLNLGYVILERNVKLVVVRKPPCTACRQRSSAYNDGTFGIMSNE